MHREFKGFKIVRFQIGDLFGQPIYHIHKLAIYKIVNNNELDKEIRSGYREPARPSQKHSHIKSFRKSSGEFRQDSN